MDSLIQHLQAHISEQRWQIYPVSYRQTGVIQRTPVTFKGDWGYAAGGWRFYYDGQKLWREYTSCAAVKRSYADHAKWWQRADQPSEISAGQKGYQRLLGAAGMEIAGITLRVLEIITVILCGIRLAVPPGHFRWERLWTKVLYWILIIFWITFNAGNIYFFKFSSLQEIIVSIGVFITLCIFFWYLFLAVICTVFYL